MNKTLKKGLLIYNATDYEKNKWFAHQLISKAPNFGLELSLLLRENLILTIEEGQFLASIMPELSPSDNLRDASPLHCPDLSPSDEISPSKTFILSQNCKLSPGAVDFVINRTRDSLIATHFEQMGCKVFNNSKVTEICNHKGKTHQLINHAHIPSVKTLLGNIHYFNPNQVPFTYPLILKTVSGHGGDEIYKINNQTELTNRIHTLRTEDFVLQELCTNPGIDIRVFTLGKEILAAVKRTSNKSFKSNYSLGGTATAYKLQPSEEALVKKILSLMDFDLVGIDFILNKEGQFLFNEIEDVVGTRTLYLNYDLDVILLLLKYISSHL
ncbi:MAG: hypothetical protein U0L26_09960 [Cellulosilyticum sp.]|nr:hypothetical protein [Cellulosilyticum sp.]